MAAMKNYEHLRTINRRGTHKASFLQVKEIPTLSGYVCSRNWAVTPTAGWNPDFLQNPELGPSNSSNSLILVYK